MTEMTNQNQAIQEGWKAELTESLKELNAVRRTKTVEYITLLRPGIKIEDFGKQYGIEAQKEMIAFLCGYGFKLSVTEESIKGSDMHFRLEHDCAFMYLGAVPKREPVKKRGGIMSLAKMMSSVMQDSRENAPYFNTWGISLIAHIYSTGLFEFPQMPSWFLEEVKKSQGK